MDYRDHRPDLNHALFVLITSGIGIRQSSRNLQLSLRCTELKLRKLARHARRLNLNLRRPLDGHVRFHFDEIESYEGQRNARPLTIGLLLESESRYVVWAEAAPIRPRGKMTAKRRLAVSRAERRHGIRKELSSRCVARTLARGARLSSEAHTVTLATDRKPTYPHLAIEAFGAKRLDHQRTSGRLERWAWNPLFAINHEEAMMRDLLGRLRRRSWLVSKKRRYLDLGLQLYMSYRNLVRRRVNCDRRSPASSLGFTPGRMTARQVLSWRQEWGRRSVHPLSRTGTTLSEWCSELD